MKRQHMIIIGMVILAILILLWYRKSHMARLVASRPSGGISGGNTGA
ncbi:MAG: hypothetical protein ACRDX8_13020 [Acidimicrobiales bacterium]